MMEQNSQSINQSIDRYYDRTKQSVNQSINQSINRPTDITMNQTANQSINQRILLSAHPGPSWRHWHPLAAASSSSVFYDYSAIQSAGSPPKTLFPNPAAVYWTKRERLWRRWEGPFAGTGWNRAAVWAASRAVAVVASQSAAVHLKALQKPVALRESAHSVAACWTRRCLWPLAAVAVWLAAISHQNCPNRKRDLSLRLLNSSQSLLKNVPEN